VTLAGSRPGEGAGLLVGVLVGAVTIVAVVAGALTAPLPTALVVAAVALVIAAVRWPLACAIVFLTSGPLFCSLFHIGPMTLDNVAVIIGATIALLCLIGRPWRIPALAVWPLCVATAVIAAAAANGGAGIEGVVRFASLTVLVLTVANSTPVVRERTAAWIETAVTLGAVVLLVQPFTGFPRPYGTTEGVGLRYGGLFGHPNFAAYTISLVLLYQIYTKRFTAWRALSTFALLMALALTGSRAALLVFILLLVPALWMRARRFFALLLAGVVVLPFVGAAMLSRLQSISETGGLSGDNASGWRFGQWAQALAATRGHELLGIGWGRTALTLGDDLGAHSTYVQIWLELGRIGTLIAVVGLVVLFRATRTSRVARILLLYAAVTGVSDPVLLYPSCLTVLLLLFVQLCAPGVAEVVPPALADADPGSLTGTGTGSGAAAAGTDEQPVSDPSRPTGLTGTGQRNA
jgi:O-antigen ligase